ncbi:BCCT family transporter [Nitratireductor pacificus]|uniref:Choline/carnitine/betaine transporter n=1 Tax=Nitratireductor pacificus pht-3B TaxID=391937 RepID=K2N713_9HYPH|nr:BCCT family transporter [Nitratireductor pacificus]EKF19933.1 choline/carnitine/betaine transporter [Nitratireductor pacificus pht-3B]
MSETTLEEDHGLEAGQDNVRVLGLDVHNPVFFVSAVLIVAFVIVTLIFRDAAGDVLGGLRTWLTSTFDWVFMLSANLFVLFCLVVALSPFGKVRLGGKDAVAEYSYSGWFAMLFAAGMGIGLMFFGVLEPMYHFNNPPLGLEAPVVDGALVAEAVPAAREMGMAATIFHWGLHPWAIYAVLALALSLATYNKGLPLSIRSAFYPIFGERIRGWVGHVIDIMAVFATLFGLATSLGFGASQALAGLNELYGVPNTDTMKVLLIMGITGVALISVVAGLDAGVKRLSEINMVLALLLLAFVIILGPTLAIVTGFFSNTWSYVKELPALSNWIGREDTGFMHGWTTFYWAWWISWSPFVGMFIARVSKGRTVREFITCVLIIPTLVSILWMTTFGGTALEQYLTEGYNGVQQTVVDYVPELSLFAMLADLPLAGVSSLIGIILVIVFFVTSSDSGSLVIDTITAGGKIDAPVAQRVFWALFEGLVAIVLLLGGGLAALQAGAIATGFPFAILLMVMLYATYKALLSEHRA